jgi:hypothetical protein
MKTLALLLLLLTAVLFPQNASAQDTLQPGPQICAQRDSICKRLNTITPAGSSIVFRLSESCMITLVASDGARVSSYSITTNHNGSLVTTSYPNNGFFTEVLNNLKKGQKIYFENIKAGDGSVKLKPVTLTWK